MLLKHQRNLVFALAITAGLSAYATSANAQVQENILPPPTRLTVERIADGVYSGRGGVGAWGGIIIGTEGVIVIDPQETPAGRERLFAEIAKLTPKPVTHVIITHANPDHFRGLIGLPREVTIIAHENAARDMDMMTNFMAEVPLWRYYLPSFTFDKKAEITIHGVKMQLLHWAPAHTSGDTSIYLPDKKVVFVGDLANPIPNIHLKNYGSSEGMLVTLKGLVDLDADTYVRGHGERAPKAEMQKILADTTVRRAKIKQLFDQGKSLTEAMREMGDAVTPTAANAPPPRLTFTGIVYRELTNGAICTGKKGGLPACAPNYSWLHLNQ